MRIDQAGDGRGASPRQHVVDHTLLGGLRGVGGPLCPGSRCPHS
jgi:hypothetical protein